MKNKKMIHMSESKIKEIWFKEIKNGKWFEIKNIYNPSIIESKTYDFSNQLSFFNIKIEFDSYLALRLDEKYMVCAESYLIGLKYGLELESLLRNDDDIFHYTFTGKERESFFFTDRESIEFRKFIRDKLKCERLAKLENIKKCNKK